jgi:DNA-binding HxlR family transcriptional regulator
MEGARRSGCPINLTLEVLGDRWSLIVIRDVMFGNRRHYRELLNQSEEGIASNILADRLKRLLEAGLLSKRDDPTHRQKAIYSLTEPAIQLVPLLVQMGAWGVRHTPASEELSIRAQLLEQGGPALWEAFMAELRSVHLGAPAPQRSVLTELQAAFEEAVARKAPAPRAAPAKPARASRRP